VFRVDPVSSESVEVTPKERFSLDLHQRENGDFVGLSQGLCLPNDAERHCCQRPVQAQDHGLADSSEFQPLALT
jgi:hypothetical protein